MYCQNDQGSQQKLGTILENKVLLRFSIISKSISDKSCSSNLQNDSTNF